MPESPDNLFGSRFLLRTAVHSLPSAAFAHGRPRALQDSRTTPEKPTGCTDAEGSFFPPPPNLLQGEARSPIEARTLAKLFARAIGSRGGRPSLEPLDVALPRQCRAPVQLARHRLCKPCSWAQAGTSRVAFQASFVFHATMLMETGRSYPRTSMPAVDGLLGDLVLERRVACRPVFPQEPERRTRCWNFKCSSWP